MKKETVEEFLARGGKIKNVKPQGTHARWMKNTWSKDGTMKNEYQLKDEEMKRKKDIIFKFFEN